MSAVTEVMRKEVIKCREDVDEEWGLNVGAERRSTHVFDENDFKNLDFSQKSLFSILSSPFHSKSPFRIGGKPTVSPSSKKSNTVEYIKAPADLSTSPTHVDFSGSNDSSSPYRRVASLPTKPPLMFDDDDDDADKYEDLEDNIQPQDEDEKEQEEEMIRTPPPPQSEIWERIQEAKARQDRIRLRLSVTREDQ